MPADGTSDRRMKRALVVATLLPLGLVGIVSAGRAAVRPDLRQYFDLSIMGGVGMLGYLVALWTLFRAVRGARAGWALAVVLYDVMMPLVIGGLVFVADYILPRE
jgi:cytochrome bd-type quinol oxidase subunit 1